ncbi:MAG: hypothetical protein WDN75_04775 [Bacteroidota bacterium]
MSRFTFEQRGIPYTSIDKDDLKSGGLRTKFDVILLPRTYGNAADFTFEIDKKFGPMPYTKTAEYPSHGAPDATNDMTGGPGLDGVAQLKQFADAGGVLIRWTTPPRFFPTLASPGVLKRSARPAFSTPDR